MYRIRQKQGSDEKWRDFSKVSKKIEKQGIEGSLGYCSNGPMEVSPPISKTRQNLGSEQKWRDFSNVSKAIEKQGIEDFF